MGNGDSSETENSELVEKLNDLKSELEIIIELRTKGAILRSKIKLHNEGEKILNISLTLKRDIISKGL